MKSTKYCYFINSQQKIFRERGKWKSSISSCVTQHELHLKQINFMKTLIPDYYTSFENKYKLGLVATLIERVFRNNSTCFYFHQTFNKIKGNLQKNTFSRYIL